MVVGKCKNESSQNPFIAKKKKAKGKPSINRTRYKRLSLGDVQTCDGILETTWKP